MSLEGLAGLAGKAGKVGSKGLGLLGSAMTHPAVAIPLALWGAYATLDDLWDEGNLVGAPDWTKAGKKKMAANFALRGVADDAVMDGHSAIMEESLARRLSDLSEVGASPRQPASYVAAKDQAFMADMAQRYKAELQKSSLNDGPSIAEIAARTGLL